MKNNVCENCGSRNFKEVNGIVTCNACGTRYPNMSLDTIGLDEELKEQEIRRLIRENNKFFSFVSNREPKLGLLTDEEILKYAPNSNAAMEVRFKNAKTTREKIKYNNTYQSIIILAVVFLPIIIIIIVMALSR